MKCRLTSLPHLRKFYSKNTLFFITIFSYLILNIHCFNPFAPALDKNPDLSNVITEQRSPEEVLQNFKIAYTFKDSLLYSDLLDEAFVFEYFDSNSGPSGEIITFARDEDLKTTGRLFRNFDVIELVWLNTVFADTTRPQRRFIRFNLSLFSADLNFIITGTAIFTFEQSAEDGKWRIVHWKDESDL